MKRYVFYCLFLGVAATLAIIAFSFSLYVSTIFVGKNSVTTYAANQGTISFYVESNMTTNESSGGGSSGGSSGGGGGGGGSAVKTTSTGVREGLSVSDTELNFGVVSGETTTREVSISNIGSTQLAINIGITGINLISGVDSNSFILAPGQSKNLVLSVKPLQSGSYAGKIIISSGDLKKEIFVILNVKSEKTLFDVSLTLPESGKVISPGKNITSFISLSQVGPPFEVDVEATYSIKDFDGNILYSDKETFSVFGKKSFSKDFQTSKLPVGDYMASVDIVYPQGFASSSAHFLIVQNELNYQTVALISLAVLSVAAIFFAFLRYKKAGRLVKKR